MRRTLVLLLLLCATSSFAQRRTMKLVLPCRDVPAYAKFMRAFGFHTVDSMSEVCRMTDGQITAAIMRMDDVKGVHLALFVDDMPYLDSILSLGSGVNDFRDENGVVNEIDVKAPGGITLYIYRSEGTPVASPQTINPACGAFVEFSVSVTNLDSAVAFWKMFGFEQTYGGVTPHPMRRVSNGSFSIGLHLDPSTETGITYASKTAAEQIAAIRSHGIEPIFSNDGKDGGAVVASFQAPEGLIVNILSVQ